MPLFNKFHEHDFGEGFQTHNSVLDIVPYDPEFLFIGTYNHGWSWNNSDFFYGRDMYMWPVLGNLFLHNCNYYVSPRTEKNTQPSLSQLFEICKKGGIVFANLVKGLKDSISISEDYQEKYVLVNDIYKWGSGVFNGMKIGEYSDDHIEYMAKFGWVDTNIDSILKFVNETKTIKHIYFTFKSGVWLVDKINSIRNGVRPGIQCCSIFTPTAKGFGKLLEQPFNKRAWGLTHCWVWNGLPHRSFINKPGYGHLDHSWLISKNVNPENF